MPDVRLPAREPKVRADPEAAWRAVGWFGLLLTAMGAGDILLAWYPPALGVTEWEFATIASSVAGLPLVTIGLAALLGSTLARGRRGQALAVGWILVLAAVLVIAALGLFALGIPLALRTVSPNALLGIQRAIVKTLYLGVGFGTAYLLAGVATIRRMR